jgi:hypothetical protein
MMSMANSIKISPTTENILHRNTFRTEGNIGFTVLFVSKRVLYGFFEPKKN